MSDARAAEPREHRVDRFRHPWWLVLAWAVAGPCLVVQGLLARQRVDAVIWAGVFALGGGLRLVGRRRGPMTRVGPDGLDVRTGFGTLRHVAWSEVAAVRAPTRWEPVTTVELREGGELRLPGVRPEEGDRLAREFTARREGPPHARPA